METNMPYGGNALSGLMLAGSNFDPKIISALKDLYQTRQDGLPVGPEFPYAQQAPAIQPPAITPAQEPTIQQVQAPVAQQTRPEEIALSMAQTGSMPQVQTPEQIAQQTAFQGVGVEPATQPVEKTFWEKTKDFAVSPTGRKVLSGLAVGLGGMAFGGRPVEGLAYGLGAAGKTAEVMRNQEVEDKKLANEEKKIDDNAIYRQLMLEQRQDLSNQKYQQALDILANKQSDPYNQARTARAQAEAQIYQLALAGDPNAQAYLNNMNAGNQTTPTLPAFPGVQERANGHSGIVKIKAPNGEIFDIPAERVNEAIANGGVLANG